MRILITDPIHPRFAADCAERGITADIHPQISRHEVLEVIGNYDGLIVNSRISCDQELVDKGGKLRFVARAGSGLEVIDTAYAAQKQIAVFNAPEGNRNAVAEHALGLLLSLTRNIVKSDREIYHGEWQREENRGEELYGKTLGLVAYGHTARSLSKRVSGFDMTVLAYDKYLQGFSDAYVRESTLTDIWQQADVVSIHLPQTPETIHYVNDSFLQSFAKPVWLINTSRGKVLDTAALIRALKTGKVKGAGLDVHENEQPATFSAEESKRHLELKEMPQVIMTPHIAGWTKESKERIAEVLVEKIDWLMQQGL